MIRGNVDVERTALNAARQAKLLLGVDVVAPVTEYDLNTKNTRTSLRVFFEDYPVCDCK